MAEHKDLYDLAIRLEAVKKRAQDLGVFTNDRELLECPQCGLKESVTFEGTLYTYRDAAINDDTGLRFPEPDEDGITTCPGCGWRLKEWL